jgi:hypothetical protein
MSIHPFFNRPLREVLGDVVQQSIYIRYLKDNHLREVIRIVLDGYPDCADEYFGFLKQITPEYGYETSSK